MIISEIIKESFEGPRIPHPEDSIFDGIVAAQKQVEALKQIIKDPSDGSIKWDGGIALYFGNINGRFVVTDKYMPAKGVYPKSPKEWKEYDQTRNKNRNDLYAKINTIWNGLKKAVGTTEGLFKADLMSVGRLQPQNGFYKFSPTTVTYKIPVNSELGKLIKGKVGIIAVHQYDKQPWHGSPELVPSSVAVIPPKAGANFSLSPPTALINNVDQVIQQKGELANQFITGMPETLKQPFKTYMNKKITKQTNDPIDVWLKSSLSKNKYQFLVGENRDGYLVKHKKGFLALVAIWNAIYQLKVNLASQLEQQVSGFEQWVGNKQEGEGFVFPTSDGLVKIVNREGFSTTHFAKNNQK